MDRTDWLRILGLPGSASDDERRAAWWTLRAHIEARLLEAGRIGAKVAFQVLHVAEAAEFILASTAGLPAEHAYLWASVAGMPDDLVERHIELSCGALRDALRDRTEAPGGD